MIESSQIKSTRVFVGTLYQCDGGFSKLTPLLKQPLDVLADEVGFEILGVVRLLEQQSVALSMVFRDSKSTLRARLDDRC